MTERSSETVRDPASGRNPKRESFTCYEFYGLSVRSQWRFPYAEHTECNSPAVELVKGTPSLFEGVFREVLNPQGPSGQPIYTRLADGSSYLRWEGLFEFLVSPEGSRIAGRRLADTPLEVFHSHLLGGVFSFALIAQGFAPLHATAIVFESEAVGFLANSGQGKSTLAGAFLQAGYPLLTDDMLVVRGEETGLTAYAGPPRIKLLPKVASALLGKYPSKTRTNPLTNKLIVPLEGEQWHSNPVPLRGLYILKLRPSARQDCRIRFQRLSQHRALQELLKMTYNPYFMEPKHLKNQFLLYASIASQIPIQLLSYPRTISSLPLVRQAILSDLAR